MALTEAQKLNVGKILGIKSYVLDAQLAYYATYITAAVETQVAVELARWDTAGIDFVSVEPREANFGARINPEQTKNDIRKNLATLLYCQELVNGGIGSNQMQTVRG